MARLSRSADRLHDALPGVQLLTLCSQALGSLLRAERPDVEERRTQMLQLQGEQSVKVRLDIHLELFRPGLDSIVGGWMGTCPRPTSATVAAFVAGQHVDTYSAAVGRTCYRVYQQ